MAGGRKKSRILVSDSTKNTREAVAEIFSQAGHQVTQARSGSDTIEILTRETFDLVFCDLDMPRTSGLEILRMARALNQQAKIVVATSSTDSAVRSRLRKEGAFDILDKPLRMATILDVAREALRRRTRTAARGRDREKQRTG